MPNVKTLPPLRIRVDWKAYWKAFSEFHGGNPVEWEGRLLFEDGWMYSATSYRGPEFPPPPTEKDGKPDPKGIADLLVLKKIYWRRRKTIVQAALNQVADVIEQFEQDQRVRKVPLQVKRWEKSEDGAFGWATSELDLEPLRLRRTELETDLEHCNKRLEELNQNAEHARSERAHLSH